MDDFFFESGETVDYICTKCKKELKVPIEAVHEFEQDNMFEGKSINTPPYVKCPKCNKLCMVPKYYKSMQGYLFEYKN
jgi:DNA-directed RNA polymerase subunit RPC12/RpoP